MKIGIVLAAIPGYSETFFRSKIAGLQENNHEVILFVNGGKKIECGCKVIFAFKPGKNPLVRLLQTILILINFILKNPVRTFRFWKLERKGGNSFNLIIKSIVINSHILPQSLDWLHFGFATMGIYRENVGKAIGAKTAVSFRGFDISIYPLKNPNCYNKLWGSVNKVHTISNDLLDQAYRLGLPTNVPVVKITPAINAGKFVLSRTRTFTHNKLCLLTVGRLHWKKGGELVMDALGILNKKGYDLEYTIVGEGPEHERLKFAAYQNQVLDKVKFLGKVDHDQIPDLMKKNDMYIQYSIQEGFCNAVLEAQAAGMLVIVSDAEGLSENVLNNMTGWVVPKLNPPALVEAIENVHALANEKKNDISIAARNRVEKEFNLQKQKKEFNDFYT